MIAAVSAELSVRTFDLIYIFLENVNLKKNIIFLVLKMRLLAQIDMTFNLSL